MSRVSSLLRTFGFILIAAVIASAANIAVVGSGEPRSFFGETGRLTATLMFQR